MRDKRHVIESFTSLEQDMPQELRSSIAWYPNAHEVRCVMVAVENGIRWICEAAVADRYEYDFHDREGGSITKRVRADVSNNGGVAIYAYKP